MTVPKPRSSPLVIICILQLMVFSGNAALLDTVPPKPMCNASNFQFPESEPESHAILYPLLPMYTATGLTISFSVKVMKQTQFPMVLSYFAGSRLQFALELPGLGFSSRVLRRSPGYWMHANGISLGQAHAALPLDEWTNVMATWNGRTGHYAIYVNGEAVVGPKQNDEFRTFFSPGGSLVLGQDQRSFHHDFRFIGRVIDLRIWPMVLEADQLDAVLKGHFPDPLSLDPLLDVPPTYVIALKNGSRCDPECQQGKYIVQDGQLEMKCENCAPGKFSMEIGSSKCLPCSPGSFSSSSGGKNCPACMIGTYQDEQGMKECKKCKADFFTIEAGNKKCKQCPQELPAIEAPEFRQCLNGKLALIAAAGINRDNTINQNQNQNMAHAVSTDKEIGKLKERHCESGEVEYPDDTFKVNREVRVNFRTKFSRTPSVTMAASRAEAFDIYKGLPFDMEPHDISTTGFTAWMNIFMVGSSRPVLHAWWMACSSGGS